ncbi:hypothetical protein PNEG_01301 [Pneumocystis murina B123]|uniref:Uncharacterized protein n=1 Tax=Pneumocystis murina (strain B123) TaxID=1069680 RepID=M7NTI8_PNEMU|nr:hypothetical protein PNEG_01301 [Pneumocystis murina B123]EMR10597.1 hypothetical protein PNEG_01301 [Pneumocystis murina B123]
MKTRKQKLARKVISDNKYEKQDSTNWQFFNANVQSPETELINDSMSHKLSITPHKESSHYAGPTFHHSPAASNLPIPSFFSKITYNTPHLQPLHFHQSSQDIQTSAPRGLCSSTQDTFFDTNSPSLSQIHSFKPLEQTSEKSLYGPSIPLSHEVHSSSPKMLFQADMNERKQKQALRKQETSDSSDFNDTFYSKTYSSIKKVGKKKEIKENTLLSLYSDFHNMQRNQKDSYQKTTFYKKNKTQLRNNMYVDNYNSNIEDMKEKLLSLLLPSPKSNKSSANT